MAQHLLSPFGADDYGADDYGADAEITIEIDPRTGQRRQVRRHRPQLHRLPPAPPGFATLSPIAQTEIRRAMMSMQGRAGLRATLDRLDNVPPRFRGDELGSDAYGADEAEQVGAELDELGADVDKAADTGNTAALASIASRLSQLETMIANLAAQGRASAPKVAAMYRRYSAIMRRVSWSSTRGLSVAAGAAAGGRGIPQVGLDYEATPAGTDQEFPFIDVSTGSSLITTTFGTPSELSFVAPFGTQIQVQNLRWKSYSGSATGIQCTELIADQSPLLYNLDGEGADMSGWVDSDPGKRPGLRVNPKMVPGANKITGVFEAIGSSGQSLTWKLFVTARVVYDSTLGNRQRPVGV